MLSSQLACETTYTGFVRGPFLEVHMVLCLRLMRCFHAHVPRTLFLTRYKLPLQMRSSAGVRAGRGRAQRKASKYEEEV